MSEPARTLLAVLVLVAVASVVPPLDQTRTTGPVTFPGAFVGALYAGAKPR